MQKHIRFDWAIKYVLRDKANFGILEGFLSELLEEDVRIENILESESNKDSESAKFNRVDLIVRNSKNELIIIEVQNTREYDYFHRILFGVSKAITEHIKEGAAYGDIKKVVSISIVYFDLGQGEDYIYKGSTVFRGINNQEILSLSDDQKAFFSKDKIEDIFPTNYIIKVQKFHNSIQRALDEWIYFFKNSEIKEEFSAKGLQEAKDKLAFIKMGEREQRIYNNYLEDLRYEASITATRKFDEEQEARRIEQDTRLQIARQMTAEGEPIEKIKRYTGLSENDLANL